MAMASDDKEKAITLQTLADKGDGILSFLSATGNLNKAVDTYDNTSTSDVREREANKNRREKIVSSVMAIADKEPEVFLGLIRDLTDINHAINGPAPKTRFISLPQSNFLADIIKAYVEKHDGDKFKALSQKNSPDEVVKGLKVIQLSGKSKQLLSTIMDQTKKKNLQYLGHVGFDFSNKLLLPYFVAKLINKLNGLHPKLMDKNFYTTWADGVIKRPDGEDEALGFPLGAKIAGGTLALSTTAALLTVFFAPAAVAAILFPALFAVMAVAFVAAAYILITSEPRGSASPPRPAEQTAPKSVEAKSDDPLAAMRKPLLDKNLSSELSDGQSGPSPTQSSSSNHVIPNVTHFQATPTGGTPSIASSEGTPEVAPKKDTQPGVTPPAEGVKPAVTPEPPKDVTL